MIKAIKKIIGFSKFFTSENVEYVLYDKRGNVKQLFQPFWLVALVIKYFGIQVPQNLFFGTWQNSLKTANLITNTGLAGLSSRIGGAGAEAVFTYLALGAGTTAANVADTTLESEITDSGLERSAAAVSQVTTTQTDDTSQLVKTWTATGAKVVTEAGVLNAASSGVLVSRQVFSAVSIGSGDSFQATYKLAVS